MHGTVTDTLNEMVVSALFDLSEIRTSPFYHVGYCIAFRNSVRSHFTLRKLVLL